MRIPRSLAPLAGALALAVVLSGAVLTPATVRASEPDTLADTQIADESSVCAGGALTFDQLVTFAATALRAGVPAARAADFDAEVANFRAALAAVRVHRDGLPVHSATVGGRTAELDNPIVTNLVNGLDAVRAGRIHETMSVSRLTVVDAVEVFILATGIVKIPAKMIAGLVPTVGFFLKPIVSAMFSGVKFLARKVQAALAANCTTPGAYPQLALDESAVAYETVNLPAPLVDLTRSLVRADGVCTPVADLTVSALVERTLDYLDHAELQLDRIEMNAVADSVQTFLAGNRVAKIMLMRRTEELGPLVDALDKGPLTFLVNLGFDIAEGRALDTVPLAQVEVENALDLVTLAADITGMLVSAGGSATGPAAGITKIVETLAFAPVDHGAPILKGVMQSMCAV